MSKVKKNSGIVVMSKTIIIDNLFDNSLIQNALEKLGSSNVSESWYSINSNHNFKFLCESLLNECFNFYDLNECVGYEYWTQNNTRPSNWHYDKDEMYYESTGLFKYPICSIVYYLKVNNLEGGLLHLEDITILPKTNRLVIFPSGIKHYVEEFSGDRVSFLINPWSYNISLGTT